MVLCSLYQSNNESLFNYWARKRLRQKEERNGEKGGKRREKEQKGSLGWMGGRDGGQKERKESDKQREGKESDKQRERKERKRDGEWERTVTMLVPGVSTGDAANDEASSLSTASLSLVFWPRGRSWENTHSLQCTCQSHISDHC